MKKLINHFLLLALATLLLACPNNEIPNNFDYGTVTDWQYSNTFF